ncbi:MAG: hypothetical protein RLY21_1887 [Planctomycetota bacterium]
MTRSGFFDFLDCCVPLLACVLAALPRASYADSPFASSVISYAPGSGAVAGFTNPAVALGSPERFTGEGLFPQAVTPFQPAYRPNEVVSIGVGGQLTLAFDHDVVDDPRNPFGADLIVFGNAFFTDSSFGLGVVAGIAAEGGTISLSEDGIEWVTVKGRAADGLFPTVGYLDALPFSTVAGTVESDFLRPVDPSITINDCVGLTYEQLLEVYDGSGGGVGIDLAAHGLARARFVRITGPSALGTSPEIDAIADVAPAAAAGDLDGDGIVGAADLATLLASWGTSDAAADLDGDGIVGAADLAAMLAAWTVGGNP